MNLPQAGLAPRIYERLFDEMKAQQVAFPGLSLCHSDRRSQLGGSALLLPCLSAARCACPHLLAPSEVCRVSDRRPAAG